MKNNKFKKTLIPFLMFLLLSGCAKKAEDEVNSSDDSSEISEDALTIDDIAGVADGACVDVPDSLGAAYSGYSMNYTLIILDNGQIKLSGSVYNSSGCQFGAGDTAYQFDSWGVIDIDGISEEVSNGTKLRITVDTALITPRQSSWVDLFDANCDFNATINSSANVLGSSCSGGGLNNIIWANSGDILYNVIKKEGNVLSIKINTSNASDALQVGLGSYPTSVNKDFELR